MHVPGIMDDWKEEIIRACYDKRLYFLKRLTELLVPTFFNNNLKTTPLDLLIYRSLDTLLLSPDTSLELALLTRDSVDRDLIQLICRGSDLLQRRK